MKSNEFANSVNRIAKEVSYRGFRRKTGKSSNHFAKIEPILVRKKKHYFSIADILDIEVGTCAQL